MVKIPLREQFGLNVKKLRKSSDLSQEEFADKCGFARSYMSRIERGKSNVSLNAIEIVAECLGVDACDLFKSN